MKIFTYDGWYGSICVVHNTSHGTVYYGKLLFMKDSITYESTDKSLLFGEFKSAIEDYIDFCEEVGKIPEKVVLIEENI